MKMKGIITAVKDVQEGMSYAGVAWRKREFIIQETDTERPSLVSFNVFNDKLEACEPLLAVGAVVEVDFTIKMRTYTKRRTINGQEQEQVFVTHELYFDALRGVN